MPGLEISIEAYWQKSQTDLSKCKVCKEVIYSSMFTMITDINGEKIVCAKACNSCFEAMNITEWREV